jgi:hypothetical protein
MIAAGPALSSEFPGVIAFSTGRNVGIKRLRFIRQEIWVPPQHETVRGPPKSAKPGFENLFHVERNAQEPDRTPGLIRHQAGFPGLLVLPLGSQLDKLRPARLLSLILDEAANPEDFHAVFLTAFGTGDNVVADALFGQLMNSLHTEPGKPVDSATANLAFALMHEIAPKGVIEAMLPSR